MSALEVSEENEDYKKILSKDGDLIRILYGRGMNVSLSDVDLVVRKNHRIRAIIEFKRTTSKKIKRFQFAILREFSSFRPTFVAFYTIEPFHMEIYSIRGRWRIFRRGGTVYFSPSGKPVQVFEKEDEFLSWIERGCPK